jgi:hypothetical protein
MTDQPTVDPITLRARVRDLLTQELDLREEWTALEARAEFISKRMRMLEEEMRELRVQRENLEIMQDGGEG